MTFSRWAPVLSLWLPELQPFSFSESAVSFCTMGLLCGPFLKRLKTMRDGMSVGLYISSMPPEGHTGWHVGGGCDEGHTGRQHPFAARHWSVCDMLWPQALESWVAPCMWGGQDTHCLKTTNAMTT